MTDAPIQWEGQLVMEIYQKGISGGFRNSIAEMSLEAYNTFVAGYNHSPIILSGETLHRLNCEYILHHTKSVEKVQYKKGSKPIFILHSTDVSGDYKASDLLLDTLTLYDTIILLKDHGLISEELALDMHALRYLRNRVVHTSRPPRLNPHNPTIELSGQDTYEIVELRATGNQIPLRYRQHKFAINVSGRKIDYIVDQEKLCIEVEKIEPQRRIVVVSLALLFSSMKYINNKLPIQLSNNIE